MSLVSRVCGFQTLTAYGDKTWEGGLNAQCCSLVCKKKRSGMDSWEVAGGVGWFSQMLVHVAWRQNILWEGHNTYIFNLHGTPLSPKKKPQIGVLRWCASVQGRKRSRHLEWCISPLCVLGDLPIITLKCLLYCTYMYRSPKKWNRSTASMCSCNRKSKTVCSLKPCILPLGVSESPVFSLHYYIAKCTYTKNDTKCIRKLVNLRASPPNKSL